MNAVSPWWKELPEDYHLTPVSTHLDRLYPFKVLGSALVDHALRTGLGSMLSTAMAAHTLSPSGIRRDVARLEFYKPLADAGDVRQVFAAPPAVPFVEHPLPRRRTPRANGVRLRHLRFESPFEPLNPALRPEYLRHRRNRDVPVLHYAHPDGPRPTILLLHGYALEDWRINNWGFSLPWLYKKGYDIMLMTQPFHGSRADLLHPYSGFGLVSGGLSHINEAILQSVSDARSCVQYLLDQGAPSVGVTGFSLGGYVSALLAAAEPRLAFSIPNSPVVTVLDMAMEWQPCGPLLRRFLLREGRTLRDLRHGMAIHSPLTWTPALPPDRLLIVSGAGDRFTSPRFVQLLHQHWTGSRLHWFPGNHVLHLHQAEYLRAMRYFMDRHSGVLQQAA